MSCQPFIDRNSFQKWFLGSSTKKRFQKCSFLTRFIRELFFVSLSLFYSFQSDPIGALQGSGLNVLNMHMTIVRMPSCNICNCIPWNLIKYLGKLIARARACVCVSHIDPEWRKAITPKKEINRLTMLAQREKEGYPSKFFLALQSFCCPLSVVLLSYDSKSTLIRLDCRKKIGREESLYPVSYTHLTLPTTPYV